MGFITDGNRNIDYVKNDLRSSMSDINEFQKIQEYAESRTMDDNYGVLSMTERWNSILMWSHYANFHKGFCIGLNESKMRNSNFFHNGGPVNYETNFPIIHPLNNEDSIEMMFMQTHRKALDWSYEKEYRLVKMFYPEIPTTEERKIFVPSDFISEVILGLKMSDLDTEQIIAECRKKNIRVFQSIKVPFKFELERKEI